MKVWELIAELAKRPAGDEVFVSGPCTLWAEIDSLDAFDDGMFGILAKDFTVVNESDGKELGSLSELEF